MSLFEEDEVNVTQKEAIPVIHHADTLTIQNDLRYTSLKSIINSIDGYPMSVDWYSTVVGANDDSRGYSNQASPIHAQYRLIKGMEIKVESPTSFSHDSQTKFSSANGSANIYPTVIPNAGDVFIADIGDGRQGLYQVTNVEVLSFFKDAVHRVQYELTTYITPQILFDLNIKTVKTYHWRKDFIDYGQSPLVEDEVIKWLRSLEEHYDKFQRMFFSVHFSNEYHTLLVPGQHSPTYDPYLTQMMLSLFASSKTQHYTTMRKLNTDEDIAYGSKTVLDAILARDTHILDYAIHKVGLTDAGYFDRDPMLHSIRYSGIRFVVYPAEKVVNVDAQNILTSKPIVKEQFDEQNLAFRGQSTGVIGTMTYDVVTGQTVNDEGQTVPVIEPISLPLIHPINKDAYYIFSEAFYTKAEQGQSVIELHVRDYLNGKQLNPHVLARLSEDLPNWGSLEKFYYLPIILMLLYVHIRQI